MSTTIDCSRSYTRENLNYTAWHEFFLANRNTPFVFVDQGEELCLMENAVAYLSDVEFNEGGFSYKLHLIKEELTEEVFLENYTIEPVYLHFYRNCRVHRSEIVALELVKTPGASDEKETE